MVSTVFIDGQTPIVAAWANDVNNYIYNGVVPPSFNLAVTGGGTGIQSTTAYAPIVGGTTTTGALQSASSGMSTVGYVLTSTGSSSVPTWQAASNTSAPQTWTALQKFTHNDFGLLGTSTGYTTLNSSLTSTSSNTLTLPITASDTLAALGTVQTWTAAQTFSAANSFTAAQTFNNSTVVILGSSTGTTTLTSANAGASNYTLTIPAVSGTAYVSGDGATNPVVVSDGGTGIITTTAYAPIIGGTTSTGALQSASTGMSTSGYVLTSTGASSAPTWQAASTTGTVQTWIAAQTFTKGDFLLLGTSTGATTLNSGLTGAGNNALTLPITSSDTIAALGTVQTWTAAQTFTQSDLILLGSSTGKTTLNSGLSSSSNNTLTLPITASDTLAALGTVQTWTAAQTFASSDLLLRGASTGATTLNSGLGSTSNNTLTLPITATDTLAALGTVQTWVAAQTFTQSDFVLLGSSTGKTTLNSGLSGSSNNTLTLPITASDTLAALGTVQTWTAVQTFTQADFTLLGSSTGKTTLNSGLNSSGNNTLTLPSTASDTLAALGTVQTWTAAQTFTQSDLVLLGSSTGKTTLNSGLSSSSNNTLTLPVTATDTLAALGTIQTWTAAQTFTQSDLVLLGSSTGKTTLNSGLSSSSNNTLTLPITASDTLAALGTIQTWTAAQTINSGKLLLAGSGSGTTTINAAATASGTITFPAVTGTVYVSGDGATNPVLVTDGGTGLATLTTAYGVVCAGTTATGNLQNAGAGTSGQVLTSNGASALPSFKTSSSATLGQTYLVSTAQFL